MAAMSATTPHGKPVRYAAGLQELADGVHAWIQPNGAWGESNAGLVLGDGASALVDTLWDQRLTRAMLDAMAPLTAAAPIALAVNTHSDGDHWWGNAELPAAAEIVTSAASLDAMRREEPPHGLARMRRLSNALRRMPGPAGAIGRYVGPMLAPFDFDGVTLRFPGRSFSGRATERVGGRTLELIEVGPAHTAGDLIVNLPGTGVVFGADILFFGITPAMWAGPVTNWLTALDLLDGLDADQFVPGHGPVGGRAEIAALRDYWTWLSEGVARHRATGRSAMQAARELIREPAFRQFRDWGEAERIAINATTIHRQLAGKGPVPATPPARARMFAHVAAIQREIEGLR